MEDKMNVETQPQEIKTEFLVGKESFHDWRLALASLREKKGMETVVNNLSDALVETAKKLDLHSDVVELYQEKHLSGQHMVMNEIVKPEKNRNKDLVERGLEMMSEGAYKAHQYIEEHSLDKMKPRSFRFLGRVEDYKGNYQESIKHYKKAIEAYKDEENPLVRVNRLEIQGFLAYSKIKAGQTKEGVELGKETFKNFHESTEGRELKEADYYTWAVWTSGIPIRIVEALVEEKALENRDWATQWLNEAEDLMVIPEDDETWGDKNFEYRKDEVKNVRKKLNLHTS